jgi:hypothetical protein
MLPDHVGGYKVCLDYGCFNVWTMVWILYFLGEMLSYLFKELEVWFSALGDGRATLTLRDRPTTRAVQLWYRRVSTALFFYVNLSPWLNVRCFTCGHCLQYSDCLPAVFMTRTAAMSNVLLTERRHCNRWICPSRGYLTNMFPPFFFEQKLGCLPKFIDKKNNKMV